MQVKGVLYFLDQKDEEEILTLLDSLDGKEISVTGITLLDQFQLMTAWTLGRQSAKKKKEEMSF